MTNIMENLVKEVHGNKTYFRSTLPREPKDSELWSLVDKYHPYQEPAETKDTSITEDQLNKMYELATKTSRQTLEKENMSEEEIYEILHFTRLVKEVKEDILPHVYKLIDLETLWEFTRRYNRLISEIKETLSKHMD